VLPMIIRKIMNMLLETKRDDFPFIPAGRLASICSCISLLLTG
jgi:hypothetical protein